MGAHLFWAAPPGTPLMGQIRLEVTLPRSELRLFDVLALKTALPRGNKKDNILLRKCHDELHGTDCQAEDCVVTHAHLEVVEGTAQNMRREMGHIADAVAGVLLAKASNVTGASDDTTKRQRTLAADGVPQICALTPG